MTYREIVAKTACVTCGAAVGTLCGVGAGRLRPEPHPQRRLDAGDSKMHNMMTFLKLKKG